MPDKVLWYTKEKSILTGIHVQLLQLLQLICICSDYSPFTELKVLNCVGSYNYFVVHSL